MRHGIRALQTLLLTGSLASSIALAGCFSHHPYSPWMSVEEPRYEKWEHATRRSHVKYEMRGEDEQREYWRWRASNS